MPILGALGQVAVRELDVIAPRRAHRWASTTPGAEIGPPDNWGRNLRLDAVAAPPASSSSSRAPSAAKGWVTRCRGDAPHQSRLALDDHRSSTGRATLARARRRGRRPQLRRASGLRDADPPRARVEGGDRSRSHGTSRSAAGASGQRCPAHAYWGTRGGRVVSSRRRRTASATTRA